MKIEVWPVQGFPLQEKVPWGLWVQEELMLELNQILLKQKQKKKNRQTNLPTCLIFELKRENHLESQSVWVESSNMRQG